MTDLKIVLKKKRSLSVSKDYLICALLILPFMKPNGIPNINRLVNTMYTALMVFSFFILALRVILRHAKLNAYTYFLFAFMGWLVLRTYAMGGHTSSLLEMMMRFCGIVVLIHLYSQKAKVLVWGFMINFELIIYLNFICLLLFPHGMYVSAQNGNWNNWLLGYDNHWFIVYFGACFILFCYAELFGSIFRPFLLFCVIHVSSLIVMSGAIIIGLAVIDIVWLFRIFRTPVFNYKTLWLATIGVNVLLLFFGSSGFINFIIYSVLHKSSATLLSRQRIWNTTIASIRENFLFGIGKQRTVDRITLYRNSHASNAHNFFLEILYEGGIVALLLFLGMIGSVEKHIKHYYDNKMVGYVLMALLACLVTGSIDSFLEDRGYMFFALLAFASNIQMFGYVPQEG